MVVMGCRIAPQYAPRINRSAVFATLRARKAAIVPADDASGSTRSRGAIAVGTTLGGDAVAAGNFRTFHRTRRAPAVPLQPVIDPAGWGAADGGRDRKCTCLSSSHAR